MRWIVMTAVAAFVLAACDGVPTQQSETYKPPSTSGLKTVRPYPDRGSVCQVIGENELTANYLDHTRTLVGCPYYEGGAIKDVMAMGAEGLEQVGDWMLFSAPN